MRVAAKRLLDELARARAVDFANLDRRSDRAVLLERHLAADQIERRAGAALLQQSSAGDWLAAFLELLRQDAEHHDGVVVVRHVGVRLLAGELLVFLGDALA